VGDISSGTKRPRRKTSFKGQGISYQEGNQEQRFRTWCMDAEKKRAYTDRLSPLKDEGYAVKMEEKMEVGYTGP